MKKNVKSAIWVRILTVLSKFLNKFCVLGAADAGAAGGDAAAAPAEKAVSEQEEEEDMDFDLFG